MNTLLLPLVFVLTVNDKKLVGVFLFVNLRINFLVILVNNRTGKRIKLLFLFRATKGVFEMLIELNRAFYVSVDLALC